MSARLVVSVHDVGPASATPTAMWLDTLDRRGLRSSLLVIPGRWRGDSLADRAAFQRLLRERRAAGDEIVQHGWRHQAGVDACGWRAVAARSLARGAGEFAALSQPTALLRLRAGHAVLADAGLATVRFVGHLRERVAVAAALGAADVALVCAPAETFGLGALEALACGTPIVAVAGAAPAEIVAAHPGAGTSAGPDPAALARAVARLSGAAHLREAARACAEAYPWSATVATMLGVHAEVVRRADATITATG
ncbi:MAG TPA: DUF2334 domain-containing protein [Jatrophihabitantaceae bacterium]|nr:DUF2334 domain-containing protein [Jatrophihabitantaceae bacterium]